MIAEIAHIVAILVGVSAITKILMEQLKLHLKQEFASKEDIKRIEKKLDHVMGRRPVTKHYSREDRVENG